MIASDQQAHNKADARPCKRKRVMPPFYEFFIVLTAVVALAGHVIVLRGEAEPPPGPDAAVESGPHDTGDTGNGATATAHGSNETVEFHGNNGPRPDPDVIDERERDHGIGRGQDPRREVR